MTLDYIEINLTNTEKILLNINDPIDIIEDYLIQTGYLDAKRPFADMFNTTNTFDKYFIVVKIFGTSGCHKYITNTGNVRIILDKDRFKGNIHLLYDNSRIEYDNFEALSKLSYEAIKITNEYKEYKVTNFSNILKMGIIYSQKQCTGDFDKFIIDVEKMHRHEI